MKFNKEKNKFFTIKCSIVIAVLIFVSNVTTTNNTVSIYLNESLGKDLSQHLNKEIKQKIKSSLPTLITTNQANQVPSTSTSNIISNNNNNNNNNNEYNVNDLTGDLESKLKDIRNNELGIPVIQEIFDSMYFSTFIRNDMEIVRNMSKKLQEKLNQTSNIITDLCNFIVGNNESIETMINPCPKDNHNKDGFKYGNEELEILKFLQNNLTHNVIKGGFFDNYLQSLLHQIIRKKPVSLNSKQQFYISKTEPNLFGCSEKINEQHLRYLYVSSIKNKHVLIMMDNGKALTKEQFEISKLAAKSVINMLNDDDFIEVITISTVYKLFTDTKNNKCHRNTINQARPKKLHRKNDSIIELFKFIDELTISDGGTTNHSLGFNISFTILQEFLRTKLNEEPFPVMLLYISRGLIPFTEAETVFKTISFGQHQLPYPILINTFGIFDEKRVVFEKQFLKDISLQNYSKYNLDVFELDDKKLFSTSGSMHIINDNNPDLLTTPSYEIFNNFFIKKFLDLNVKIHSPKIDLNSKDFLVSMTKSCDAKGMFGIDFYLSDLAEDITYYNRFKNSYAFMIDINGKTIMHPSFPRPIKTIDNYNSVDILYFEMVSGFDVIREQMLKYNNGNATIQDIEQEKNLTYSWSRSSNFYIIVIATINSDKKINKMQSEKIRYYQQNERNLLYHRIDLISPSSHHPNRLCRHFRQVATLDNGTFYLSPSAFPSPFVHLKNNKEINENNTIHYIQTILSYIKDRTRLLANPGVIKEVRDDVSVLLKVMFYLKEKFLQGSALKKYVIRRYITTINGVMLVYPGCVLDSDFEPTRRNWFIKAMEHPGKIILTEPYLDLGGAGYIVTVSHTIFEGKANALHNAYTDIPVAVVSMDVPQGLFYKLILEASGYCSESNVKCFLMEDKGFLISHPSILKPITINNIRRSAEHITHKESYVANDILNHKILVKKNVCNNYLNNTIQRYYQFNTSLTGILTNFVPGERTKYQIASVPSTNLFIGIVNSSHDDGAFCPCSRVDRLCLNCNRMEQTECECPCECPLFLNHTIDTKCMKSGDYYKYNENIKLNNSDDITIEQELSVCPAVPEQFIMIQSQELTERKLDMLNPCININCELYTTQFDCLGVIGCEWCQLDVDGDTLLNTQFCTTQITCFNGVLGSVTPYGDGQIGSAIIDQIVPPAYSAIGPVVGAIIALCLVVGFAMYCYRQNVDVGDTAEHLYIDSIPENCGMPMSHLDFKDILPHDDGGDMNGSNGHQNLLTAANSNLVISEISPYRIATNYRRPNGDSDNGYSTMTPHEDSEHHCFTLIDPLIQQKRMSMSDSASINTSVSSPHNHHLNLIPIDRPKTTINNIDPSQTMLLPSLPPNHILVPVTVHRNMEAS